MLNWGIVFGKKETMFHDIIECLVAALEARDVYTYGQSSRVADMVLDLSNKIGLTGSELENIHIAAHLHDIGKIGIPDRILNKQGILFPHEWAQVQQHPEIGYNILNKSPKLKSIAYIVLYHHERWDGKGYPKGLKGNNIPLGSRVIAVCDAVDAMTSARPYRPALTWEECFQEIVVNKGLQFDAVLVEAAVELRFVWEKKFGLMGNAVNS